MIIKLAQTAGFCFGVQRAVDMAFQLAEQGKSAYTYGELIHNPYIVQKLSEKGVHKIEHADENTDARSVIIRSHGVPPTVYEAFSKIGCEVVDATCPFVKKIHAIVKKYSVDHQIMIAGDRNHPEVEGISGCCQTPPLYFNSIEELEDRFLEIQEKEKLQVAVVAQTTFSVDTWEKCVEKIKKQYTNLKIFDTICIATEKRQHEAVMLAAECDAMIIIGGRHSSNTNKLSALCGQYCDAFLIENASEMYELDLSGYNIIGITAGASTPACIIKEVHKTMSEILKDQDELSFEEMLEQSFKTIYNKEKVTAVVTGVASNEISVDIGTKHAGYVPLSELTEDPNAKIEDLVKVGDEIELMVIRVNDVEGTVMLSKKRLDQIAGFEKVMEAAETEEILDGVVVEVIKGGVLALTNGVKVFIPASQATASRAESLESLLKQTVRFRILETNRSRRRAVGSIRSVLRDERKKLEDEFWTTAEVGKKYMGTVKSLTSYGAFVNLGGVDGMIHISELSWSRIKHPSEVVSVGDEVEVYIRDMDTENKKISLGYKKSEENPWEIMKSKYAVGSACTVKIVSLTAFGAFAQVIPGVDGLIHISQISNERINKPSDVLSVGQEVEVKITELDTENRRVSLSMRALLEEAPKEEAASEEDASSVIYEAGPDGATGEDA